MTAWVVVGLLLLAGCGSEPGNGSDGRPDSTSVERSLTVQDLIRGSLDGDLATVRRAVEQGVGPNVTDRRSNGNTPLMLAAYNGHVEVVRFLLEEGARIDARNAQGRTPLIFASTGSFPETVSLLLERGADPNATDDAEKWSALMFAAAEGHEEVVRILLEHGADPALEDRDGETAATFARNGDHTEIADLLAE